MGLLQTVFGTPVRRVTATTAVLALAAAGVVATSDTGPGPEGCPTGTEVTAPFRPTIEDISLKVDQQAGHFTWFHGCTATQTQRRAMEQLSLSYTSTVFRYAKQVPACDVAITRFLSVIGGRQPRYKGPTRTVLTQFDGSPIYDDIAGAGTDSAPAKRTSWSVKIDGGHYGGEHYTFLNVQGCSTGTTGKARCAQVITGPLLTLLDMRIGTSGDGTEVCVKGSNQVLSPPRESYSSTRGNLGLASGRCLVATQWNPTTHLCRTLDVPPLSANDLELLRQAHDAHAQSSAQHCGGPAPTLSVTATHEAYEGGARTEAEHGFRRLQDFLGTPDPAWSAQDVCTLFTIADDLHAQWAKCQIALDWACSDRAGKAHHRAHYCIGLKDDRLMVKPPGEPADHTFKDLMGQRYAHPNVTCAQWIAEYRGAA